MSTWYYIFATIPIVVAVAVSFAYQTFKLAKSDPKLAKNFMYMTTENGTVLPLLIGHRGGHYEAPENTLVSIRTAKRNGASSVELDLDFTEDGYAIIIHDDTVDRTTNGSGLVRNMKFQQIRELNAAYHAKQLLYKDGTETQAGFEQVPTLKEVVELSIELGVKIILDVKSNPKLTAKALKELAKEKPDIYKFVIVTSFYPDIIYQVKSEDPNYLVGFIWRYDYSSMTINGIPRYTGIKHLCMSFLDCVIAYLVQSWLPDFLGIDAVSMHKDQISRRYLDGWRSKGIEVMAWTVNHPVEKDHFLRYLKIPIITDSILNSWECVEQTH